MAHKIIKISDYTKKTDGRCDGEFSGDWFLEKILWPSVRNGWLNCKCPIEIIFDDVEYKPGFLDQAFSKLISKYHFAETKDCFIFTCKDKNIIADVMAAIIGAEYKTFGQVLTDIWK